MKSSEKALFIDQLASDNNEVKSFQGDMLQVIHEVNVTRWLAEHFWVRY